MRRGDVLHGTNYRVWPIKTVCPTCGADMGLGERVNVTLGWERMERRSGRGGGEYDMCGIKSKSTKICRACAERIARESGMPVPGWLEGEAK